MPKITDITPKARSIWQLDLRNEEVQFLADILSRVSGDKGTRAYMAEDLLRTFSDGAGIEPDCTAEDIIEGDFLRFFDPDDADDISEDTEEDQEA